MKPLSILLTSVIVVLSSACATSSAPKDRARELADNRCDTTLRRMQNFVKHFYPTPNVYTIPHMYKKGYLGVRGYDLLGDLYYQGCNSAGLISDKSQAADWYQHAAIGHVPESQYKLGKMLFEGDGITKDEKGGMNWLMSAALEGDSQARRYLTTRNISPPAPVYPNSYQVIQQRIVQYEREQRARSMSNLLQLVGLAAVTYSAASLNNSNNQQSAYTPAYNPQPTYQPINVQRFKPVYCSTISNINVSGVGNNALLTGTANTFCY